MNKVNKILLICLCLLYGQEVISQNVKTDKSLYHVLLFQWSVDQDVKAKSEIIRLFEDLPTKIDGFESVSIENLVMSTDNFDTIIVQKYSSDEALKEYQTHPDHLRIVDLAPLAISKISKFDYWE